MNIRRTVKYLLPIGYLTVATSIYRDIRVRMLLKDKKGEILFVSAIWPYLLCTYASYKFMLQSAKMINIIEDTVTKRKR
mgnify:FL=1